MMYCYTAEETEESRASLGFCVTRIRVQTANFHKFSGSVFGCMCYLASTKPETWHRDESLKCFQTDIQC